MNGKIVKLSSNDLNGNVDNRDICIYACFLDKKYNNQYIVFCYDNEYDKNTLYYGSVHFKKDSLVIFNVKNKIDDTILEFVNEYLNKSIDSNKFEIISVMDINKIEMVSNNSIQFDKLLELEQVSFVRPKIEDEIEESKNIFWKLVLIILILVAGLITYLYFYPDVLEKEYKTLSCKNDSLYNDDIKLSYKEELEFKFDLEEKVNYSLVKDTYTFSSSEKYYDFKDNNKEGLYFNKGSYKYVDNNYSLIIMYSSDLVITDYTELKGHLKSNGFSCVEGKYYE